MSDVVPPTALTEVQLRFLCHDDIENVKHLCADWFPIEYPDSWYQDITSNKKFFSLAATFRGGIVGMIVAEIKGRTKVHKEDGDILASSFPVDTQLGAFNIRSFGDKKSSNTTLMDIISTIVHHYDIILIQEVRDNDLAATKKLMEHVNKDSHQFSYIISEPLGRSTYKERYLFLYREQKVSVAKNYTYDDGCEPCGTDTLIREPFVVMFSSTYTAVKNFVLIPQHTSPDFAVHEMDALYDVVADVRSRWNTNDIVLLGDFNAGCNFVLGSEWEQIRLFTDKSFHWLIPDSVDTTVTHTNCPYDRIVVTDGMMKSVVQGSAEVYDFMVDLKLSHSLALAVSDHYPVEVKLTAA